jgi:hypothetical protein
MAKTTQWIGEDVPELSSCLNVPKLEQSFLDAVMDEVESYIDVLVAIM